MDEDSFEDRLETASDEMMDDSISEVRGEYLSLDGITHDECATGLESIGSTFYLFVEFYAFGLVVQLELESTIGMTLVSPTVIVCREDVGEGKHDARDIHFRRKEQRRRTIESESGIVRVTTIAIESESIEAIVIRSRSHPVRSLALVHDSGIIRIEVAWSDRDISYVTPSK